jgi:uncharacterized protein (DUF1501 family)
LASGNDGLKNTVILSAGGQLSRVRPKLACLADKVLKLDSYVGLNPRLTGLKTLHDSVELTIVQGVGYPNPNRSHFRSTDIWQTASDANQFSSEGWIGRYFDNCCSGADPTVGVAIGDQSPQAFSAKNPTGVTLSRPEQFRWKASTGTDGKPLSGEETFYRQLIGAAQENIPTEGSSISSLPGKMHNDASTEDFLRRTALDAQLSSDKILAIARKYKSNVPYPPGSLGASFNLIARMIAGGLPTRVYYASQGGFDTHAGQIGSHDRLLGVIDDAIAAFVADLKQQGNFQRVLLVTFSEFGPSRKCEQWNRSRHGGADVSRRRWSEAVLFGKHLSLTDLDNGGFEIQHRFSHRLRNGLDKWLWCASQLFLGKKFSTLPIV